MRLKVFIGTTLAAVVAMAPSPASAQGEPPTDSAPPTSGTPSEQPAQPPSSGAAPTEAAPKDASPPPAAEQGSGERPGTGAASNGVVVGTGESVTDADSGPVKVGEELSPLVVTAGLGYAYAAVNHPDIVSHGLSGGFLEITVGTELDRRFRLALSFTSFETKLRRTESGQWEEGEYQKKVATHALADPIDPVTAQTGGMEVQKTFHAHSLGPRMDFLPLGSQGPYLGMTAAVAIMQDVPTRVGLDLAARVGGEWRPFHTLGLAIEAGAHGQLYDGANAAIPYALARMSLMLEPANLRASSAPTNPTTLSMPRTLPPPAPR